ncbi:hypothetical protein Droror1_Dr00022625 [Drosera rotundifolia]
MAMPDLSKEAHCPAYMMQPLPGLDALNQLFPDLDTWAQKDVLAGQNREAGALPSASLAFFLAPLTKTKQVPGMSVLSSPRLH